jgi:membrane protein DedA with SNARE-associated domain
MNHFLASLAHHGYVLVFAAVLAEALGLPAPAALALMAGGAAAAVGTLSPAAVFAVALVAMLLGDSLLFVLGGYMGWGLLGFLCQVSANPESCILRSAESFYKRGKTTLLIAKFIPGVNSMAPPLAGSMKMRPLLFLRLDVAGAALYVGAYTAVGFLFHDFLASITRGLNAASHTMAELLVAAAIGYIVYKVLLFRKHKVYRVLPRVQVEELARKLSSEGKENIQLVDVRSHGYYDADTMRIQGSLRLEPNHLSEELRILPKDKDIYLYCT